MGCISRQELHTRGGVLDRMLDSLFDTAILVDTDCRILYISASSFPDPSQRAAVVGQHISVLDQLSPFEEVLRTGQPRPDLFLELHGRPCISSLFPVLDGERVIGVVGTITVRNLGRLKKVLSQLSDQAAGFRGLYQDLARVDSGYRLEDFVGESPRVADLLDKARKAAHSGESVLILEGKLTTEIIASGIHAERHGGRPLPYVTINCTAIPEAALESGHRFIITRRASPAPPRHGWASFPAPAGGRGYPAGRDRGHGSADAVQAAAGAGVPGV